MCLRAYDGTDEYKLALGRRRRRRKRHLLRRLLPIYMHTGRSCVHTVHTHTNIGLGKEAHAASKKETRTG